jgi:hypothetical protein
VAHFSVKKPAQFWVKINREAPELVDRDDEIPI